MKSYLFSVFMIFVTLVMVNSQEPSDALKIAFQDGEYFLAREDYIDALVEFQRVYKRGYDYANVNYRIGICYLNIRGQKQKAIPYLEEAIKNVTFDYDEGTIKEEEAFVDAFLLLGNAYRINNEIDKAISTYNAFKGLFKGKGDKDWEIYKSYADQQIEACKRAREEVKNPVIISKENLGEVINSSSSNYHAVMDGSGNSLVYMNEFPFYDAVYYTTRNDDNTWNKPVNITPDIQSDGDQIVSSLSSDGTTMFLTRFDFFDSNILESTLQDDGVWSVSSEIRKNVNTKYWESHASLSPSSDTLYFANNNEDGFGGMDIYYAVRNEKGDWDKPVNLGADINTELSEDNPFITQNGQRLFFVSQGHTSIGGFDIFYSEKDNTGSWKKPVNMGYPINTTDDEMFYFPIGDGSCGLVDLIDPDGYGKEDIYKICLVHEKEIQKSISKKVEADFEEEMETQLTTDTIPLKDSIVHDTLIVNLHDKVDDILKTDSVKENNQPIFEKEAITAPEKFEVSNIYFAFDSYSLNADALAMLDEISELMKKKKNYMSKYLAIPMAWAPIVTILSFQKTGQMQPRVI